MAFCWQKQNDKNLPESEPKKTIYLSIKHQDFWRKLIAQFHTSSIILAIVCSGLASLMAAFKHSITAAIFAFSATMFLTIEKTLMLSEKWKLHLRTQIDLENVLLKLETGRLKEDECADEVAKIKERYASDLPIEHAEAYRQISSLNKKLNEFKAIKKP
ncbi:hypothetical protein QUF75_02285 [Desulfococcaceae bacterium HSG7]|nr:hypothetical protein [Desulfococcaceae bacterium HSG7]